MAPWVRSSWEWSASPAMDAAALVWRAQALLAWGLRGGWVVSVVRTMAATMLIASEARCVCAWEVAGSCGTPCLGRAASVEVRS